MSDREIIIAWKEPINPNGIIRNYHIRAYKTRTGRKVLERTVAKERYQHQHQYVENLYPFTIFMFTIQAETIKIGEMANFTAETLEGGKFESFMCLTL